jgi:ribosomal protein L13E
MHHIKPAITKQNGHQRQGKGFSPDEVKQAGLTFANAKTLGIPVDFKRKTAHEENTAAIKSHWAKHQAENPPQPKLQPEPLTAAPKKKAKN